MKRQQMGETKPTVAVVGAAGHTGRLVVAELARRGMVPIAIARNAEALAAADFFGYEVLRRQASIDDVPSLDRALAGAKAVIHCAGPFMDTADAVIASALRAGIHYLDLSAEQTSTRDALTKYDSLAREAGVAVVPAMGFYGGFADLLTTAALGDWDQADAIDIMIGLDSWHPTRGTKITGERNRAERMVVTEGRLTPLMLPPAETQWEFADPLGAQTMIEVPFSEIILIAEHIRTTALHTYLSSVALKDLRNSATPAPRATDAIWRSAQNFVVDVVICRGGESRRMTARGRDIYAFSAPLVCEAVQRLLDGRFRCVGAHPPGVLFDAQELLSDLVPDHLSIEVSSGRNVVRVSS